MRQLGLVTQTESLKQEIRYQECIVCQRQVDASDKIFKVFGGDGVYHYDCRDEYYERLLELQPDEPRSEAEKISDSGPMPI